MTDFKPGDKVRTTVAKIECTIEFGPFNAGPRDVSTYVVRYNNNGVGAVLLAELLESIPPADPRVEVARQAVVRSWDDDLDAEQEARAILAALDAMPQGQNGAGAIPGVIEGLSPSAPRRVRDRDGDVWERNAQGTWGLTWSVDTVHMKRHYEDVDRRYGPLTPIS